MTSSQSPHQDVSIEVQKKKIGLKEPLFGPLFANYKKISKMQISQILLNLPKIQWLSYNLLIQAFPLMCTKNG